MGLMLIKLTYKFHNKITYESEIGQISEWISINYFVWKWQDNQLEKA